MALIHISTKDLNRTLTNGQGKEHLTHCSPHGLHKAIALHVIPRWVEVVSNTLTEAWQRKGASSHKEEQSKKHNHHWLSDTLNTFNQTKGHNGKGDTCHCHHADKHDVRICQQVIKLDHSSLSGGALWEEPSERAQAIVE